MNREHKRYIRKLMSIGQCSLLVRQVAQGLAVFFAVLPWIMLGLLCAKPFAGVPSGTGAFFLFTYLAVVSLFYHYTRALSAHWGGYPFYPEDQSLFARFHHAIALVAVSGMILLPWSWLVAAAVVVGLFCLDLAFESGAMNFGEHAVRTARVRFDTVVTSLAEAVTPAERMSRVIGLPGIYREENEPEDMLSFDAPSDPNTTQCQKRTLHLNGAESIEGMVRVSFQEGEEQTAIHLAFCPSLRTAPEIQTDTVSELDMEVEAETTLSQMYGARIELKRTASTAGSLPAQSVSLYYYASVPAISEKIAQ